VRYIIWAAVERREWGATMRRPTAVTVIAWVWIVLGGFACLGSLWGGFGYIMIHSAAQQAPPPDEMDWFFSFFGVAVLAQTGVGTLAIVAGTRFLKLRTWARMCLEVLSWFAVVFLVGYSIFWSIIWFILTGESGAEGPHGFGMMRIIAPLMGLLMMGGFAIPFVLMIRSLRSTKVRAAVNRAAIIEGQGATNGSTWAWTVCGDAPAEAPSPLLIYPSYTGAPPRLRQAEPAGYAVVTSTGVARLAIAAGSVVLWDPDAEKAVVIADEWDAQLADNHTAVDAFVTGLMSSRDG